MTGAKRKVRYVQEAMLIARKTEVQLAMTTAMAVKTWSALERSRHR
jgi:hypothetical protein